MSREELIHPRAAMSAVPCAGHPAAIPSSSSWVALLERHDAMVHALHSWVNDLEARLSPVLRPPCEDGEGVGTMRTVPDSALARKIDELAVQYDTVAKRLSTLLERIDL